MAWIKVTGPEGHLVYLCIEQIMRVRLNIAQADSPPASNSRASSHDRREGEWSSAKTIVDLVNGLQAVRETQAEVMTLLKDAGAQQDAP